MANIKAKKAAIISFTKEGGQLAYRILLFLQQKGYICTGYQKTARPDTFFPKLHPVSCSLIQWAGEQFSFAEILIFIGAAGIAVRASAPWINDKFHDPAVLVVDETGKFVIPLLSGHMGGANDFARMLAAALHAVPVITTATDLHGCFAVDVFAKERGLWITNRRLAKEMSAEALNGSPIGIFSDIAVKKEEVPGCCLEDAGKINLYIGIWKKEKWEEKIPRKNTLQLVPKVLTLGIGCRKGIAPEELRRQVMEGLDEWGVWPQAVKRLATITLKKEEKAIIELSREMHWEVCWFSPEELKTAEGDFSYSAFVERITGVGNVCERAAVLGAGSALLLKKTVRKGVTMAAALESE